MRVAPVRAGWLATAVVVAALLALAVPPAVARLARTCAGPACTQADLTAEGVAELTRLGLSPTLYGAALVGSSLAIALAYLGVGALLVWQRPDQPMAVFAAFTLLLFGPLSFAGLVPVLVDLYPWARIPVGLLQYAGGGLFTAFLFVFPDGRFVPRWTRWVAAAWIVGQVPLTFFPQLEPAGRALFAQLRAPFFVVGLTAAAYGQLRRYRLVSTAAQRAQTKWTALGFSLGLGGFLVTTLVSLWLGPGELSPLLVVLLQGARVAAMSLIPLSIGVAVLRHRLFDVDALISRTLVYGGLTAAVVAVYVLTVGYLGLLLRTDDALIVSLVGTGAAAALVQPLRERLQRSVNRLVYGQRDEPYAVLSRLGERLDAAAAAGGALPAVAETVVGALRLPYAALRVARAGELETAAAAGTPTATLQVLPLLHRGELVGELVVGQEPGEPLDASDRRLLEDIARRAGAAVHAARLADELRRSRERLVSAREEERRRLRRDLHDGLGPTLAGLTLKLQAARNRLGHDPAAAALLDELAERAQTAVADVRRVTHELRPPALDELGLVGALRRTAASFEARGGDAPCVEVCADTLPPLPAAVEVAAYRIAQEALTNVVRHAGAGTARLSLVAALGPPAELVVEVVDDGRGLPPARRPGVGLTSMRERAEELGGSCAVLSPPEGGTRVVARLPLPDAVGAEVPTP
jgi:signal transduction histidine kinase